MKRENMLVSKSDTFMEPVRREKNETIIIIHIKYKSYTANVYHSLKRIIVKIDPNAKIVETFRKTKFLHNIIVKII